MTVPSSSSTPSMPGPPNRRSPTVALVNARLAVATLEGRLNSLLLTGGVSSRSAIGLAALLDARGWSEIAALVGCSGLTFPASAASGGGRAKLNPEVQAKLWLDQLAHDAVYGLVKAGDKPVGFEAIAPPDFGFEAVTPLAGFKVIAPAL